MTDAGMVLSSPISISCADTAAICAMFFLPEALMSLGYNKNEAMNVLKSLDEGLDTQSYIRKALTLL